MGNAVSNEYVYVLTEWVLTLLKNMGNDLEAFEEHRGKKTITHKDVKLYWRNNPENIVQKMEEYIDSIKKTKKVLFYQFLWVVSMNFLFHPKIVF